MMSRPSPDLIDNGYGNPSNPSNFMSRGRSQQQSNFHSNAGGFGGPQDNNDLRQRFMQQANSQGLQNPTPMTPGGSLMMEAQGMMGHHQGMQPINAPSSSGYRGQHDNFTNSPSMNHMGNPFNMTDLSPSITQRMGMGPGNSLFNAGGHGAGHQLAPQMVSATSTTSPTFTPRAAMVDVLEGRQPLSTSSQGAGPGSRNSDPLSQAEREEELLLNLLIARRQRGRMSGESPMAAAGIASGRSAQSLADELIRLRQGRNAIATAGMRSGHPMQQGVGGGNKHGNPSPHHSRFGNDLQVTGVGGRGGSNPQMHHQLPPIPGMPPLYTDTANSALTSTGGHRHHSHMNSGIHQQSYDNFMLKSEAVMGLQNTVMQDVSERIDRSPMGLMDARSQELRDFSGRGMKRGPLAVGVSPGGMSYDGTQHLKYHGLDMQGLEGPAAKKKRTHKKKPADMPRRPLSAYNLFFSEERERILKEIEGKEGGDSSATGGNALGVDNENKDDKSMTGDSVSSEQKKEVGEGDTKPKALLRPMIPCQKKRRPHRKTHGKISFQQLARMVGERWKSLPEERRKYYQDLAQEDMKRQKAAMEEYYAKQNAGKSGKDDNDTADMDAEEQEELNHKALEQDSSI